MIYPATHTLMFMWYLTALDSDSQNALRPMMDIMCDPECTVLQRKIAYNYLDSWMSAKARNL